MRVLSKRIFTLIVIMAVGTFGWSLFAKEGHSLIQTTGGPEPSGVTPECALPLCLVEGQCVDPVEVALRPFLNDGGVEPVSGYPWEGNNQTNLTQPTAIGFYLQFLAAIVADNISPERRPFDSLEAMARLEQVLNSLLMHQANETNELGWRGLIPWYSYSPEGGWSRSGNDYFVLGDNVNLAASLGATSGALQRAAEAGAVDNVESIVDMIENFLDNQAVGFDTLCGGLENETDPVVRDRRRCPDCCFDGWNPVTNNWLNEGAVRQVFADEFMNGLTFVHLRSQLHYAAAPTDRFAGLRALKVHFREYTSPDGRVFATLAAPDGGAFQYLWSLLYMPHATTAGELAPWQSAFVDIALADAEARGHHGFLSAAFRDEDVYDGSLGIPQLATRDGIHSDVATLYTLGPAHAAMPEASGTSICDALATVPGLITDNHLFDGIRYDPTPTLVPEQVVANSLSLALGMVGVGASDTFRYLESCTSCSNLSDVIPATTQDSDLVTDVEDRFVGLGDSVVTRTDMGLVVTPMNDVPLSRERNSGLFLEFFQSRFNASGTQVTLRIDQITGGLNHDGLVVEFKSRITGEERIRFVLSGDACGSVQRDRIEFDFQLPATLALVDLDLAFVGFFCDPTEPSCRLPSFRLRQLKISP